jgi:hypothetical protein
MLHSFVLDLDFSPPPPHPVASWVAWEFLEALLDWVPPSCLLWLFCLCLERQICSQWTEDTSILPSQSEAYTACGCQVSVRDQGLAG